MAFIMMYERPITEVRRKETPWYNFWTFEYESVEVGTEHWYITTRDVLGITVPSWSQSREEAIAFDKEEDVPPYLLYDLFKIGGKYTKIGL